MPLTDYRTLGRSGLAVSPLALGTMTFGTARWGTDEAASRAVFDAYVEAGGNFIDTADVYAGGNGEAMLGGFVAARSLRDRLVIATKSGFAVGEGPHQGGNGAKHVRAALDGSLRRLRTDYIDLYWTQVWDGVTPAEELLERMAALVRAGKVRYWGMSNAPAWYIAKLATLAAMRGLPGPIAMQFFYSLVNRDVEDEHIPLAAEFGMAWFRGRRSPSASSPASTIARRSRRPGRAEAVFRRTRPAPVTFVPPTTSAWMAPTRSATASSPRATGTSWRRCVGSRTRWVSRRPAWRWLGSWPGPASPRP